MYMCVGVYFPFGQLPMTYNLAFLVYSHYISKYISTFLQNNFHSTPTSKEIGRCFLHLLSLHYLHYVVLLASGSLEHIICFYIFLTKPA